MSRTQQHVVAIKSPSIDRAKANSWDSWEKGAALFCRLENLIVYRSVGIFAESNTCHGFQDKMHREVCY